MVYLVEERLHSRDIVRHKEVDLFPSGFIHIKQYHTLNVKLLLLVMGSVNVDLSLTNMVRFWLIITLQEAEALVVDALDLKHIEFIVHTNKTITIS